MTGFWALVRKDILEQRRSWGVVAMVGVFTLIALLITIIPYIVTEVRGEDQGVEQARDLLEGFDFTMSLLGSLFAIGIAMGSLANERASGTAAMTLSKPVTRIAFVASRYLGVVVAIFVSLVVASVVAYLLTLILFDNGGLGRFAAFIGTVGVYLLFIASISFFWSGMFIRQMVVGGVTLVLFIMQISISEIPHTQRFWPVNTVEWGSSTFNADSDNSASRYWPGFAIACGSIVLLSSGAWVAFRRKEL